MAGSRQWSPEEDALAWKLRNQGKTYREIARCLNRTEAAVSQRLSGKTPVDLNLNESLLLCRTKLSFIVGAVYEIKHIGRSGGIDYLPAHFEFIGEVKGKPHTLYIFKSINGGYVTTFTYPQIMGSYVFRRLEGQDKEK